MGIELCPATLLPVGPIGVSSTSETTGWGLKHYEYTCKQTAVQGKLSFPMVSKEPETLHQGPNMLMVVCVGVYCTTRSLAAEWVFLFGDVSLVFAQLRAICEMVKSFRTTRWSVGRFMHLFLTTFRNLWARALVSWRVALTTLLCH